MASDQEPAEQAPTAPAAPLLVGRDRELAQLLELYEAAGVGRRQIVLLRGAPGIGKTALVGELVRVLSSSTSPPRIGRGQCFRRYASCEPYGPLLSALATLSSDLKADDEVWSASPTWLAQLPDLLSADQHERLRDSLVGSGSARMLREGVQLFERLSEREPVVLVLEDLHRADRATLDWLTQAARRTGQARLLVIATLRAGAGAHGAGAIPTAFGSAPDHGDRVTEISLEPLSRDACREYLEARLARSEGSVLSAPDRAALADASGGHALFLEMLADEARRTGGLPDPMPAGLRELLVRWLDELPPADVELLEAASVSGTTFPIRELAAMLHRPLLDVHADCERLVADGRILQRGERGESPREARYAFRHLLLLQTVAERIANGARRILHGALADFLEREQAGNRSRQIARLLWHSEAAGDVVRAADCLELAARQVLERFAYREVADFTDREIAAIHRLPESRKNILREAARQLDYGNVVVGVWGFGDARAYRAYDRAYEQAARFDDELLMFRAQLGRCLSALVAGDAAMREAAGELLRIAARGHTELSSVANLYNSYVHFASGDFAKAARHALAAEQTLSQAMRGVPVLTDLEGFVHVALSLALTPTGALGDAAAHRQRAIERLDLCGFPFQRAADRAILAVAALIADDPHTTLALADQAIELVEHHAVHAPPTLAACCRAWALHRLGEGTLESMESAIEERARARELWMQSLLFVAAAEACCTAGNLERAAYWLRRAERIRGESAFDAERWRVRGVLMRTLEADRGGPVADGLREVLLREAPERMTADACFERALRTARGQGAALFEERARNGWAQRA